MTPSLGGHGASAGQQQPKLGMEINYMGFTIDHYGMGVMMAQMCIENAVHATLRELCERNLDAQTAELGQLQSWRLTSYGISYEPRLTQGDRRMMELLAALEGAEFEIEFMETLSRHHHRVVQRSEPVASQAVHAELRICAGRHSGANGRHPPDADGSASGTTSVVHASESRRTDGRVNTGRGGASLAPVSDQPELW